ncbi:MAG TPA: hypothetical protein V6D18_05835 [Thermosynechococcaceae cyanobacterium]
MDSSETAQLQSETLSSSALLERLNLKRVRNLTRILYTSAIAHTLTLSSQTPPAIVADQLANDLTQRLQQSAFAFDLPIPPEAQSTLRIQSTPNGLIQVELSDWSIALWLGAVLSASDPCPSPLILPTALAPERVFAAQYAHARCCSLLCLAHAECLGQTQAEPIAWLNSSKDLPLTLSARHLVCELFSSWEFLLQPRSGSPDKLLFSLIQRFQAFHSTTQMFDQPERGRVEVNCGLLLATQRVLHWWLTLLHLPAPVQL